MFPRAALGVILAIAVLAANVYFWTDRAGAAEARGARQRTTSGRYLCSSERKAAWSSSQRRLLWAQTTTETATVIARLPGPMRAPLACRCL